LHQQLADANRKPEVVPKRKAESKGLQNAPLQTAKANAKAPPAKSIGSGAPDARVAAFKQTSLKIPTKSTSGCISLSIDRDLPANAPPMFSPEQLDIVNSFLQRFPPVKSEEPKGRNETVVHVEVNKEVRGLPCTFLTDDQCKALRNFQNWYEKRKVVG